MIAAVTASEVGWSGIRISSVPNFGCGPDVPPEPRVVGADAEPHEVVDERLPLLVGRERGRSAAPGQLCEHLGTVRLHAGLLAREIRRVGREREHDRQPRQDAFERVEARLGARHADVDVQAADALPPGRHARVGDELRVARLVGDLLVLGPAQRMASRRRETQAPLLGQTARLGAQLAQRLLGLGRRRADLGVQLERGGEELALSVPGSPEPLEAAINSAARGASKSVSASSTINSSSTPIEKGGDSPKCDSITNQVSQRSRRQRDPPPEPGLARREAHKRKERSNASSERRLLNHTKRAPTRKEGA